MTTMLAEPTKSISGPGSDGRPDVVIVGGGAVGLGTAMALSETGVRILVIEAEKKLAAHQTGNNSGVIHSGLYYKPGSLKARLCTAGREMMYRFCAEHGIPHERCGKIVVATREDELPALAELERRGNANGLVGVKRLSPDEMRHYEPHVAGIAGLVVHETGIVDYKAVTAKYAAIVRSRGGEVRTEVKLLAVRRFDDELVLETTVGDIHTRGLINCAGLQSDRVARMCGVDPKVQIIPFRGEYYELTKAAEPLVRNLIYPVPDPRFPFLGVHFTRMIQGGVEAGPNAVLALCRHGYCWKNVNLKDLLTIAGFGGFWRMARKYWKAGLGEMHRSLSRKAFLTALQRLLPELKDEHIHPAGAGVRAQAVDPSGKLVDDFHIVHANRMVHVLNAPSPAATASIAIGQHIAAEARESLALKR